MLRRKNGKKKKKKNIWNSNFKFAEIFKQENCVKKQTKKQCIFDPKWQEKVLLSRDVSVVTKGGGFNHLYMLFLCEIVFNL